MAKLLHTLNINFININKFFNATGYFKHKNKLMEQIKQQISNK